MAASNPPSDNAALDDSTSATGGDSPTDATRPTDALSPTSGESLTSAASAVGDTAATGAAEADSETASGSGMARRAAFNSVRLGGALLVSWVLALVGRLLIPNVLGRDDFGQLTFIEGVAALVMSIIGFGLGSYITKEVSVRPEHAADFAVPLARVRIVAGLLLAAAMGTVFWVVDGPETGLIAFGFALARLALAIAMTNAAFLDAVQMAKPASNAAIFTKLVWFGLLVAGLTIDGRLIVVPIALAISETLRAAWLNRHIRIAFEPDRHAPISAALRVIRSSTPYYVNSLNVYFMSFSVPIVVRTVAGRSANGLFSAAHVAQSIPLLFAPVILSIMMPVLSRVRSISADLMWERMRSLLDHLLVPLVAMGVGTLCLSPIVVGILFRDPEFATAERPLAILALGIPATYLTVLLSNAFVSDDRAWQNTRINMATMVLVVVGVTVAVSLNDATPTRAATAAAATLLAGEWITVFLLLVVRPPGRLSGGTVVRLIALAFAAALGAAAYLVPGDTAERTIDLLRYGGLLVAVGVLATELPRTLHFVKTILRGA